MPKITNNTLIALMNSRLDFEIAKSQYWYRIPTDIKSVPQIIRNSKVKFIAFYHTAVFAREKFTIRYYAIVRKISIVKRKELLPDPQYKPSEREEYFKKAEKLYYKIEFEPLQKLQQPIISIRHRRLLFIP